jgi:hypothetical protein
MVERLVLPEGCPGAAENLVGHAAGSPFEPSHDGGHRGTRFEDCMDVIWHDHPRVEFVEPADCLTIEESVHNYAGDSRILQPGGTGSYAVESLVLPKEGSAATLLRGQNLCLRRKGAGKSPRHENSGLLWNPVRQMSAGEGHRGLSRHDRPQKAMVCPTCSRGVVSYRARVSPGNIQTPCRTLPASHRAPTSSKGAYTRCLPLGNCAVKIASDVFQVAAKKSTQGKQRIKLKFRKLDVIAAFLLIQDLLRNNLFKVDTSFTHKLAAHILADRDTSAAGKSTSGPAIAKYYAEWRTKIIEEIGVRLDPKRLFDDAEKQIIFGRAQGKCELCSQPVDPADAEYDHFPDPHALGGKTVVENARLVHATCHPRGPAHAKTAADEASDQQKAYQDMLKCLCDQVRASKPDLSQAEVLIRAKKRYERQRLMEDD